MCKTTPCRAGFENELRSLVVPKIKTVPYWVCNDAAVLHPNGMIIRVRVDGGYSELDLCMRDVKLDLL